MGNTIALGITIGATMSGSFGSVLGSTKTRLTGLGAEIKGLSANRGIIERFEKDQVALEKTRLQLSATSKEVGKLKLALKKNPGDEGTAKALEATRAKADKLSASLEKQKARLRESEAALSKAGLSVKNLGGQYAQLGRTMDLTRSRYTKLESVMAKKSAAGTRLQEMKGQMLGLAGAAYGAAKLLGKSMDFEHELRLFGNISNLTNDRLGEIRLQMKGVAEETNQDPGNLLLGLKTQVGAGLGIEQALGDMQGLGMTATATGAEMEDLAKTAFSLSSNLGVLDASGKGLNMLAVAGKLGSFELKAMAQYFPMLTAQAKSLKLEGYEAVASLSSMLQIARRGAGDDASAANNLQNFLMKLTAPETVAHFKKVGVDIKKTMDDAVLSGKNPVDKMLEVIKQKTGGDQFKIGELFGDMQVKGFLVPMLEDLADYREIKAATFSDSDAILKDFKNMMGTTREDVKGLTITLGSLGDAVARTFLPAVRTVITPLKEIAEWASAAQERFPVVSKAIGGVAIALGGATLALGTVTAATWLWNSALLANPIGLVAAAVGGAAVLVVTQWGTISGFFKDLWNDILNNFKSVWGTITNLVIANPLYILFRAAKTGLGGLGNTITDIGKTMREYDERQQKTKMSFGPRIALAPSLGALVSASSAIYGDRQPAYAALDIPPAKSQTVTVDARVTSPITIQAAPGMDEKAIAEAVGRMLREREREAAARARGALHD